MNPWLTEGDAWFRRNQKALETAAEGDWALKLIEKHGLVQPDSIIVEAGCANGWRLAAIGKRYNAAYLVGFDVSLAAIQDGQQHWPSYVHLHNFGLADIESLCGLWGWGQANLVICYFVLHWIEREDLIQSLITLDGFIQDGGHLLIGDFLPDAPTKVPYHHREGLWTWKVDYAGIFLATGNYRLIDRVIFDHDTGEEGDMNIPVYRRAAVSLLRKEDCYEVGIRE